MASILQDQINLRRNSSHTYTVSYHTDWTLGPGLASRPALHGGHVAAAIHYVASTHLSTTLAAQNQPDILALHYDFLRQCERCDSTVTVVDLKLGAGTSTLQLELSQKGRVKAIALATSTNFDKPVGPSAPTAWREQLNPPPKPVPDFDAVLAHRPDEHWLPARLRGEIMPFTCRMLVLNPRGGFPVDGVCDAWNSFAGDERIDATYLAMMADCIPSMSDTLLRNGGMYDARSNFALVERWAETRPGVPAELANTLQDAMRATLFNNTVTLDIEFKRRLPREGVKWTFTRTVARSLLDGRMDLDVTILDENMELLCLSRQVVLVLEATRKFGGRGGKSKPSL